VIDALENTSKLTYDNKGNLVKHIDPLEKESFYEYDNNGNIIGVIDALKNKTQYAYDEKQQLVEIVHPDQSKENFNYNSLGKLIQYTDAKNNSTAYTVDSEGRPLTRTNALGGTLEYKYDTAGRLLSLSNENKRSYNFSYDPLDRLIKEQGLDGIETAYGYSPVGNVVKKVELVDNIEAIVTKFERDKAGNLVEKEISRNDEKEITTYGYDPLNQLITATNPTASIALRYDELGQLLEESTVIGQDEYESNLVHEYDALGNRTQSILPNGKKVNWYYKLDKHLEKIEVDGKSLTTYQRDALNREISKTQGSLQSSSEYDSLGRLIKQTTLKSGKEELNSIVPNPKEKLLQRSYSYDKVGELLEINDQRKGKFSYGYDKLGRVTHAKTPSLSETFAFDPAHNLIEEGDFNKQRNQIETYQDKRYTYDAFGNMETKKISNHTQMKLGYNLEHQMTQARVTRNKITQNYSYAYDPFGRRVSKTDAFNTTYFTWDGNRLLSEKRGEKEQNYIYEQDGFVPVATLENEKINYYHTDHLGTPQEMTNMEGEIVWEAEYSTWGNSAKVSSQQVDAKIQNEVAFQPLRFQCQY
jgi:YD repeat-containing protein